jgi:hypothetical protein
MFKEFFVPSHFKACLYRRWIIVKRSWDSVVRSIIATLIFSSLAVICFYLMRFLIRRESIPVTFNSLPHAAQSNDICFEINESETAEFKAIASEFVEIFIEKLRSDMGRDPIVHGFTSRDH